MRPSPHRRRSSARPLTWLAAVLAITACERDVLREEARPAGPSNVGSSTPATSVGSFDVVDINERGDIVGNGPSGPYRWTRSGGPQPLAWTGASARVSGINNAGVAVGTIVLDNWTRATRAVIWGVDGQPQLLPVPAGWHWMNGSVINDAGVVAGSVSAFGGRSFRWSEERGPELLPSPGPHAHHGTATGYDEYVTAINNAGDIAAKIVESCYDDSGPFDCYEYGEWQGAVVWRASGSVQVRTFDEPYVSVADIDESGAVVGCMGDPTVVWGPGGLMPEFGCASGINASGVVVGTYEVPDHPGTQHAFRWTSAGGLQDLGTLGGGSSGAAGINDAGEITGWSHLPSGHWRAFIWTESQGMQALVLPRGTEWSVGMKINDAGEIAGVAVGGSGATEVRVAARWSDTAVDHRPVANPGGPYRGRITGRRYTYTAVGSAASDTSEPRYRWDMDADGRFEGATSSPFFHYTYAWPGTHTIRLVMRDASGRLDTATTTVTVAQNVAPVAAVSGLPTSAPEGGLLTATASVTDANQAADSTELGLLRYRWEWSDGYVSTGSVSRHRFPDEGSHGIRLIVTDAGGLADTVVRAMPVGNVAPTARFTTPTSIGEGRPFTLTASALSDVPADVADGLQVAFNCGGGYGAYGTALSIVCPARADQGSVSVGLRVRDQDGGGSGTTRAIPVGNVAPRVTAGATTPTTFAAGGSLSLSGTFTDVAGDAPWRYRIYWGDGAYTLLTPVAAGATIKGSHVYRTPGSYAAYVGVVDKDGGSARSAPIAVTVTP